MVESKDNIVKIIKSMNLIDNEKTNRNNKTKENVTHNLKVSKVEIEFDESEIWMANRN